jgi:hypothetical protein
MSIVTDDTSDSAGIWRHNGRAVLDLSPREIDLTLDDLARDGCLAPTV